MSKYQKHFLLTVVLVIAAVIVQFVKPFNRGLDIDGGLRVVMQVAPKNPSDWPVSPTDQKEKMDGIRKTIVQRVKGLGGVAEPLVYVQNNNRLVVELAGVKDPDEALRRIGSTASLEFYYLDNVRTPNNSLAQWQMNAQDGENKGYTFLGPNNERLDSLNEEDAKKILTDVVGAAPKTGAVPGKKYNEPVLTGKDILPNTKTGKNPDGKIVINLTFNNEGTQKFGEFTKRHVNDILAVFFDGKLLTAPKINEPIMNGQAEVTGFNSLVEARETAEFLNAGALPVPMVVISKDIVEPTLGRETIAKVVMAGIAGLVLVIFFMGIYYKLPGIIADIALCLYALFVIAIFKAIGATMSLAGVAALIISIGMAVDANILIFERLKEELRAGKTLNAAIDAGFKRAFTAIFDSNMCTAITCGILMWKGTASVQSFALTLLVGVAVSMFTAITVTRTILHLLVGWEWAQKPDLYGLNTNWMSGVKWNIVGKRNAFFALSALLIVPGVIFMFVNHSNNGEWLRRGIEFKSGTSIQATFKQPVQQDVIMDITSKYSKSVEVQLSKIGGEEKRAFIKTLPLSETDQNKLRDDLNSKYQLIENKAGVPSFDSTSLVSPTISSELTRNAFLSVLAASALIILYLTGRFAISGLADGFKYGVCAVIALIHDALFILGLFAILGYVLKWEIDSLFVTAVLTIIGFSVHDTIVVFDRIRENLRHRERGETFEELANKSVIQTLSRSINTSFTVVLTLTTLIAFGGPLLRHFYVAMLVGIIIGTYSSIFNATPLVVVWEKIANKAGAEPKKKAFEEKALVEVPMAPVPSAEKSAVVDTADSSDSDAEKSARIKRKTTKKRRF